MSEAQTESCPACGSLLDVSGAHIFAERTCPVCGTQINVRRKFGHYELVGVMGSGGQGVVYRAVDNNLNRLVALKLLRTEFSQDDEFVRQFEQEAQVTASINHPNVVRVFSFGADEGHVYLAMELVDQGTMDDLMEKLGKIPEARALQIGIEVAQGLRAGNERGLVHRDVKPGNVLFSQDGTAKIVDYGLAMFFEQEALASGEIWGTPYYLSPERLNKVPEDFRSDIYSLGATLFHAIAGRPPFEAEDASHVALKHLRAQAVSLQTFAPNVSNATSYVINRTLAKNPADRPESYEQFIEELQFAREEALAHARGGGKKSHARVVLENAEATKANHWLTIATLGILVAGLAVAGIVLFKAFNKNDEISNAAPPSAVTDLSSFGPGWGEARRTLLGGDYPAAAAAFRQLVDKQPAGSTQRAWALVHQALAQLLAGQTDDAPATLAALAGGGTQVSKFFHEEVAPRLRGNEAVPQSQARDFNSRNHQALGAFFFALKDYQLGAADDARELLRQFRAAAPDPSLAWLEDYKRLAEPLQAQFAIYSPAVDAWSSARTTAEREKAFVALEAMPAQLPENSRLRARAEEMVVNARKRLAEERELRMKSNVAYHAKVTASGFDDSKGDAPENAVDGDPKTRWSLKKEGEKWLALDLGTAKPISRWVVKTAGFGGERSDMNIREIKLQKSSDGQAWADVDALQDNRQDILDRVVPPFSSRYVRLLTLKGGVKSGDVGIRIFEFELGSAEDQAKAGYTPGESLAVRFSPESPLVGGSIGDPGILGNAAYDAKSGRYTIQGGGGDLGGAADSFHFVWQPMKGDGEIIARVQSLEKKHPRGKAGLLIRSDLGKDGAFAFIGAISEGSAQFLARKDPRGSTTSADRAGMSLPRWLKLVREGKTVISFESADGKQWDELGRETIAVHTVAFVGLAVCSHVQGQLVTAEFDQVKVTDK